MLQLGPENLLVQSPLCSYSKKGQVSVAELSLSVSSLQMSLKLAQLTDPQPPGPSSAEVPNRPRPQSLVALTASHRIASPIAPNRWWNLLHRSIAPIPNPEGRNPTAGHHLPAAHISL